jgi:hypothetical protein
MILITMANFMANGSDMFFRLNLISWIFSNKNNYRSGLASCNQLNARVSQVLRFLHSPKIYIMVKQLSKAMPTRNLQAEKVQKVLQKAVAMPPTQPTRLVPTRAGILPKRSAIQPKTNPPKMAPQKKMD